MVSDVKGRLSFEKQLLSSGCKNDDLSRDKGYIAKKIIGFERGSKILCDVDAILTLKLLKA